MGQMRYLIPQAITDKLTLDLIVNVDESDPIRASVIKYGRFQDNPIVYPLYVAVAGGNLRKPDQNDGIVTLKEMEGIGLRIPPREIGGGVYWWRRGWVEVGCYFIAKSYNEEQAAEYAHDFLGRVEKSINNLNICGLTDDFNEQAYMLFVYGDNFTEGGGPPNQYLWRGQVLWQALTMRPQ